MTILSEMNAGQRAEFGAAVVAAGGAMLGNLPLNNRRIVTFGSSSLATATDGAPSPLDQGYGYQISSTLNNRRSSSMMTWLMYLSGQQFDYKKEYNFATSQATVATQLPLVDAALDALQPGFAVWQPGINDISGIPDGGGAAVLSAIRASDEAFIAKCVARGVKPVLVGLPPRTVWSGANTSLSNQRRRALHSANVMRRNLAIQARGGIFIDIWSYWCNPDNSANTDGSPFADRVRPDQHPSDGPGGYWSGVAAWDAFRNEGVIYSPPVRNDGFSGSATVGAENAFANRLANGAMQGTATNNLNNASGTHPTSWAISRITGSTGTMAGSQAARPDGLPGLCPQFAIASNDAADQIFRVFQTVSGIADLAGQTVEGRIALDISAAVNGVSPTLTIEYRDASNALLFTAQHGGNRGTMLDVVASRGVMATDPHVVPANAVSATLTAFFGLAGSANAGSATVRVSDAFFGRAA